MKKIIVAGVFTLMVASSGFAHGSCGSTDLHGYMMDIKKEMRAMGSEAKKGNNAAASKHVESLITIFQKSREETPYQLTSQGLKGAELEAQMADYQKIVDDTIILLSNLNTALKANDSDNIKKLMGSVGGQRKIGHRAFAQDC